MTQWEILIQTRASMSEISKALATADLMEDVLILADIYNDTVQ